MIDFSNMNETDVREVIVRPFLERLGYRHGTKNNIRTELTLRYDNAFLGRKSPSKDPPLAGRADYILEVIGIGRWVVEVKSPANDISQDDVEQAHTYAAHPEVGSLYFLVCNGRQFRLYKVGALEVPLFAWEHQETDEFFIAIENVLGPEAIRCKTQLLNFDEEKPLGKGLSSVVRIVSGYVKYENHVANFSLLDVDSINGLELPITGGEVSRLPDGRLQANVKVAKPAPMMGEINDLLEREDGYFFFSTDEYVSTDQDQPTLFQNSEDINVPKGTQIQVPGLGQVPLPFGYRIFSVTEATGFFSDHKFVGTMSLSYEFFYDIPAHMLPLIEQHVGTIPEIPKASGGGRFELELRTF